jgi:tellurite resistance protein
MINHHAALIETMFLVSAADTDMTDAELRIIGEIVSFLPIFADYDSSQMEGTLRECAEILGQEDGLTRGLESIKRALPAKLRETAYALACDVVAADGEATQEELRVLELLREHLELERLVAAAIERSTRARFTRLDPV